MESTHLPDDWADRPITDADVLEGVVDLFATAESRAKGMVHLLVCDPDGHFERTVLVRVPGFNDDPAETERVYGEMFTGLQGHGMCAAVAVVARPGDTTPTTRDLTYTRAVRRAAAATGFGLLGLAIAAPDAVASMSLDDEVPGLDGEAEAAATEPSRA